MNQRESQFRRSLPLLEATFRWLDYGDESPSDTPLQSGNDGCSVRVAVIGPTEQELRDHAPVLHEYVARRKELLLPVNDKTDLDEILERFWKWQDEDFCGTFLVLALPDGLNLKRQMKRLEVIAQGLSKGTIHERTSPSLGLAARARSYQILLAVNDEDLSGDESKKLRHHLFTLQHEQLEHFVSIPTQERNWGEFWCGNIGPDGKKIPVEQLLAEHRSASIGLVSPQFVWRFPIRDATAVNIALLEPRKLIRVQDSTHLRCHTSSCTEELLEAPETLLEHMRRLLDSAKPNCGRAKTEDDVYISTLDLMESANWSPVDAEHRRLSWQDYASHRGWMLRAIGKICRVREVGVLPDILPPEIESACCWIWLDGPYAGYVDLKPTESAKSGELKCEHWACLECQSPAEAQLLYRLLSDPNILWRLDDQMRGIVGPPKLLLHMVAEMMLPWPAGDEPLKLLERMRSALWEIGDSDDFADPEPHEAWPSGWKELEELRRPLRRMAQFLSEDELIGSQPFEVFSPITFLRLCDDIREAHGRLAERLAKFIPLNEASDSLPLPLAVCVHQMRTDKEAAQRMTLSFDALDVLLKYDCAIRLALVESLKPRATSEIFQQFESKATDKLLLSMGQWQALRRASSSRLREMMDEAHDSDPYEDVGSNEFGLQKLSVQVLRSQGNEKLIDQFIKDRNNLKGHGFTTHTPYARSILASDLCDRVEAIIKTMPYFGERRLALLEGREVRRSDTILHIRMLMGPFDSGVHVNWTMPHDELPKATDGELYLNHVKPFGLLNLSPWLIWDRPSESAKEPTVWLFDGFNEKGAIYKSPQHPGQELLRRDLLKDILQLIRGK